MAGYVYRGTEFDAHEPITEPIRPVGQKARALCGTRSGYMAHRKHGEDPCQPCREANTAYSAEWNSRRKYRQVKKGWTDAKCGTYAGYRSHEYHAVPACETCKAAQIAYLSRYRSRRKAA